MAADETLSLVRTYHEAWTSRNFDQAVSLLAIDLKVEVSINDHPTTESFAAALEGFGSMTSNVNLLSEMSAGNEAMWSWS